MVPEHLLMSELSRELEYALEDGETVYSLFPMRNLFSRWKQETATKYGPAKGKIVAGKTVRIDTPERASAICTQLHLFQSNASVHINASLSFKHRVVS
ncbi:hypothetical protein NC651_029851 [Populus alba x Populus x berolinensis]|nr:hypothetical protein NC651_029851 [Populus alba x Populus x berolinensis]